MTDPPPRARSTGGWTLLLGAGLLAGELAVLLTHLSVPQPTDHANYMNAAQSFPAAPENPILRHQYLRIGLTAPTAWIMDHYGYSEVTYHAFPIACALVLVTATYAIGCMLFGRLVGAVAAVLLAGTGTMAGGGTELMPDLPATAMFTAAVAVTVAVRTGHPLARGPVLRRAAFVLIGVLMGWSYLIREFIVFVWPLIPLLLWRRVGRFEWLLGVVPLVLTGAGEMVLNAHLYGDPLVRLHASAGLGDVPARPEVAETFRNLPMLVYLGRLPEQLALWPEGMFLIEMLAATVVGGLLARRLGVFLVWLALLWVPLTLLGGVLNPEAPRLRIQLLRYWYPLFPAIVLGGVAAVWLAAHWLAPRLRAPLGTSWLRAPRLRGLEPRATRVCAVWVRAALPVAMVGVLAVSMLKVAYAGRPAGHGWRDDPRLRVAGTGALPEFRAWLTEHHHEVIRLRADRRMIRILPIYFNSPTGRPIWLNWLWVLRDAEKAAPGDYVVVYSAGSTACGRCGDEAYALLGPDLTPPATWRPVMTSSDGLLRVWRVEYDRDEGGR